ncbi:serine/threonine-protein phosphatase [Natronosporangium hydrolyticum]|uniref:Serine/threonine-protein phosphatase n=1 Tax=Natronosporangium hydrolyticum TaxID=2811111 RepID=A0A895Y8B2_9ACTN|nr:PP2C family protein-serine/threonine phosphatase [Natronosporangium hydrolyticum]QSB13947.1 serine/threonine-protein phosphatase [Natronosporangium hydrolyticum]
MTATAVRGSFATAVERRAETLFAEAAQRLAGTLNQRRCLHAIAELAVAHLADVAVVLGPSAKPYAEGVRLAAAGHLTELRMLPQELADVPALVEAMTSAPPASRWLDPGTLPGRLLPSGVAPLGQVLLTPMSGDGVPGGALLLGWRAGRAPKSDDELAVARTFATRAGAAMAAALLYREQSEAMAVLQAELLPPQLPRLLGAELAGGYRPAERGLLVGGDFYDVFTPAGAGSRTVVVLGDVCGKGAPAAALTGKVRQTLRALHLVEQEPAMLLRVLNDALLQPGQSGQLSHSGQFVTLVLGQLDRLPGGGLRLTFATGGHPTPLVLRANGQVSEVPVAGTLVGVVPTLQVGTASVELAPGDICLLYSDGMTEARGGDSGREQFGEHRFRQALRDCHGWTAEAVVSHLEQLVVDWSGGAIQDDIAMLAIRSRPLAGNGLALPVSRS